MKRMLYFYIILSLIGTAMRANTLELESSLMATKVCPAPTLTVGAACTTGNNTGATAETDEVEGFCFVNGANAVWYQFVAPATGVVSITTSNGPAAGDTEIALYAFPDCTDYSTAYELACSQDISGTNYLSTISNIEVPSGETVYIQVSGWNGWEGEFCINVVEEAPCGAGVPVNDECLNAEMLTLNVNGSCTVINNTNTDNTCASNSYFTSGQTDPTCAGLENPPKDIWFQVEVPANGEFNFSFISTPGASSTVELYDDCAGPPLAGFACNNNGDRDFTGLTPGATVYFRVWDFNSDQFGTHEICLTTCLPPVNDECSNAEMLTLNIDGSCTIINNTNTDNSCASNSNATSGAPDGGCAGLDIDPIDIWFQAEVPANGQFTFSFISTPGASSTVELYDDCAGPPLAGFSCANTPNRDFTGLTPGATVYFRVWDFNSDNFGTHEICLTTCLTSPPPTNDECANAEMLTLNVDGTCSIINTTNTDNSCSTNSDATSGPVDATCAGIAIPTRDIWFQAEVPANGQFTFTFVSFPGASSVVELYDDCAGPPLAGFPCTNDASRDFTGLTPGATIYFRVWDFNSDQFGTHEICLTSCLEIPVNDECANAETLTISNSCTNTTGTVQCATDSGIAACTGTANNDVWYTFTPTGDNPFILVAGQGDFDAVFEVFDACGGTSLACVNGSGAGGLEALDGTNVAAITGGNQYWIRVFDAGNDIPVTKDFDICITEPVGCDGSSCANPICEINVRPLNDLPTNITELTENVFTAVTAAGTGTVCAEFAYSGGSGEATLTHLPIFAENGDVDGTRECASTATAIEVFQPDAGNPGNADCSSPFIDGTDALTGLTDGDTYVICITYDIQDDPAAGNGTTEGVCELTGVYMSVTPIECFADAGTMTTTPAATGSYRLCPGETISFASNNDWGNPLGNVANDQTAPAGVYIGQWSTAPTGVSVLSDPDFDGVLGSEPLGSFGTATLTNTLQDGSSVWVTTVASSDEANGQVGTVDCFDVNEGDAIQIIYLTPVTASTADACNAGSYDVTLSALTGGNPTYDGTGNYMVSDDAGGTSGPVALNGDYTVASVPPNTLVTFTVMDGDCSYTFTHTTPNTIAATLTLSTGTEACEYEIVDITTSPSSPTIKSITGTAVTDNGDGTGTFDPSAAGPGSHDITFSYTDDGTGCVFTDTKSITVDGNSLDYSQTAGSGLSMDDGTGCYAAPVNNGDPFIINIDNSCVPASAAPLGGFSAGGTTERAVCTGSLSFDNAPVYYMIECDPNGGILDISVSPVTTTQGTITQVEAMLYGPLSPGACPGAIDISTGAPADCDSDSDPTAGLSLSTNVNGGDVYVVVVDTDGGKGNFTVSGSNTALPLRLISFEGNAVGENNEIVWKTSLEQGIEYYELQRSDISGDDFEPLGVLRATSDPQSVNIYEYIDESPLALGYYRLKVKEENGHISFSDVIAIKRPIDGTTFSNIFPNPASSQITVNYEISKYEPVTMTIVSMLGRVMHQETFNPELGLNVEKIDLTKYASGIYYLSITDGRKKEHHKFEVIK